MSNNIGKNIINIPESVKISLIGFGNYDNIVVEGRLGKILISYPSDITVSVKDNVISMSSTTNKAI
jgi:ribosomal protein L6P/L9E